MIIQTELTEIRVAYTIDTIFQIFQRVSYRLPNQIKEANFRTLQHYKSPKKSWPIPVSFTGYWLVSDKQKNY